MADASRDQNRVTTLLGVSNVDGTTPVTVYADPVTHRLLVDGGGSAGITVGTTTITNGTDKGILYDNAGVVGEYTPSASLILATDASKNVVGLATATYPSLTELSYVKGVTSAIQTQLNAKGAGTVTTLSVVSANGFAGTVANATTTPAITLTTTITGTLQGNGTAISASKVTLTQPASGSTLTIIDGKTLTINKTISFTAADDTGVYTLPTGTKTLVATDVATLSSLTSVGTVTTGTWGTGAVIAGVTMTLGSDASYDMYYRGATGVLTRLANGTTGQVLTATTSAAPSWATASGGSTTMKLPLPFDVLARLSQTSTNGTRTIGTTGLLLDTTSNSTSYIKVQWTAGTPNNANLFGAGTILSFQIEYTQAGTTSQAFFGLGDINAAGSGITFGTFSSVGIKCLNVAGTCSVYGTCGNGTEAATSALTTLVANDVLDVVIKYTSTSQVDYSLRKNGGSVITGQITTHIPTGGNGYTTWTVSNGGTSQQTQWSLVGGTLER